MSVSHSSASVYKVPWHFLLPHGVYTTQCCQLYLRLPPLPSLLSISPAFSPTQLQNLPRPEQMQIEGFLIHFHPVVHPPHSCQDGPLTQRPWKAASPSEWRNNPSLYYSRPSRTHWTYHFTLVFICAFSVLQVKHDWCHYYYYYCHSYCQQTAPITWLWCCHGCWKTAAYLRGEHLLSSPYVPSTVLKHFSSTGSHHIITDPLRRAWQVSEIQANRDLSSTLTALLMSLSLSIFILAISSGGRYCCSQQHFTDEEAKASRIKGTHAKTWDRRCSLHMPPTPNPCAIRTALLPRILHPSPRSHLLAAWGQGWGPILLCSPEPPSPMSSTFTARYLLWG